MTTPNLIRIFLASSSELKKDREEVIMHIHKLNDIYDGKFVFKPEVWEHLDEGYNGKASQRRYNEKVQNSQVFIALFHRLAGRYTIEELYEARKAIEEHNLRSICIFQKKLGEEDNEEVRLKKLKKILDLRYKYFMPPAYNHVAELCLRVNMSVQRLLESFRQNNEYESIPHFEVRDSRIMLGETCVGDINKLSFSANNNDIIRLKKELEDSSVSLSDINKEIDSIQEKINKKNLTIIKFEKTESPGTPNEEWEYEWNEYKKEIIELDGELTARQYQKVQIKNKINNISEELEKQNTLLLDLVYQINRLSVESKSKRLQQASLFLEQGDNHDIAKILTVDDIKKDVDKNEKKIQQAESMLENSRKLLQDNVEELLICAKNCLTDRSNVNRFKDACKIREEAIVIAEKCFTGQEYAYLVYKYARFLDKNKRFEKALFFYNKANGIYLSLPENHYLFSVDPDLLLSTPPSNSMSVIARCANLTGNIYNILGKYQAAENSYQKAFMYYQTLLHHYPDSMYYHNIILVKSNLGVLYYKNDKKEEGEELLTAVMLEYENMSEEEKQKYLADISIIWLNIGCFYKNDTRRHRKARMYIQKALEAYRKLNNEDKNKYKPDIATCLYHLGNLYVDNDWKESEVYLLESLNIRKIMADDKPQIYLPEVASTYSSLGKNYWYKSERLFEKMSSRENILDESLNSDLETYKKLITQSIEMYQYSLRDYTDLETEVQSDSQNTYFFYSERSADIYFALGQLFTKIEQWHFAFDAYNNSLKKYSDLSKLNNAYKTMVNYIEVNMKQIKEYIKQQQI